MVSETPAVQLAKSYGILRKERERKRRKELARRTRLLEQAGLWVKSKNLEAFLEAAATEMQEMGSVGEGNAAANWLAWSRNLASQLNPFNKFHRFSSWNS